MSSNSGRDMDVCSRFIEVSLWVRRPHCIPPLKFWNVVKNMFHKQENRLRAIENRLLGGR
jgi:hypothetical protein